MDKNRNIFFLKLMMAKLCVGNSKNKKNKIWHVDVMLKYDDYNNEVY